MGELRSATHLSIQLHERLREQGLPAHLLASIGKSLDVLLEEDEDGVRPNERSFQALLRFISDHRRWVAPGLAINRRGDFIAVWEIPGVVRWSIEFLPSGEVEWTVLEKTSGTGPVRRSDTARAESLPVPERLRTSILAE
jgi:hypothetical protein